MSGRPAGPPLARLFAIGYRALVDGLHTRLRARGWDDVRPAFGFALLAAREGPTTATSLARLMGTTKQAASRLLDTMEAAGYLGRTEGGDDRRRRPVRLAPRGRELLDTVEAIYAELEAEWAAALGRRELERLRRSLTKVLSSPEGLPPVRPTW